MRQLYTSTDRGIKRRLNDEVVAVSAARCKRIEQKWRNPSARAVILRPREGSSKGEAGQYGVSIYRRASASDRLRPFAWGSG